MARFICPKCKGEVDANATACPNCGVRFARSANESTQAQAQATPPAQPTPPPAQQPETQKAEATSSEPKANKNNGGFSEEELEKYRKQDDLLSNTNVEKKEKASEMPSLTLQNQADTKAENTAEKSKKPLIIGLCVVAAIILIVVICMVSSCNNIRSEDANGSNTSGSNTSSNASSDNKNSPAAGKSSKPAKTQKTVVYTTMPEEWKGETMYAYLYIASEGEETKENAAFPGVEMTKSDDGKYSYEIPDGFENALVIFSTGNGVGEQFPYYNTDGYKIENGKTYSFEEYKKEYEAANPKE